MPLLLPPPLPGLTGFVDDNDDDEETDDDDGSSRASTVRQEAMAPASRSPARETRAFGSADPATARATSLGAAAAGGGGNTAGPGEVEVENGDKDDGKG